MRWIEKRKEILFDRLLNHTITPSELRELDLLCHLKDDDTLLAFLDKLEKDHLHENNSLPQESNVDMGALLQQIKNKELFRKRQRILLCCACMVLVVVIVVAFFHYGSNKEEVEEVFVGKDCSPLVPNRDLPREFFACDVEIKDLFQKRIDNQDMGVVVNFNNVELSQKLPGVLQLAVRSDKRFTSSENRFVTLTTPPKRQFILSLPNGVTIRLDGGSRLHCLLNGKDTTVTYCRLEGQAYVNVPANGEKKLLIMENYNSQLLTCGGEYTVRSELGYTKAIRLRGDIFLATLQSPEAKPLEMHNNMMEVYTVNGTKGNKRDSLALASQDEATAIHWTQSIRHYKDVSLRAFMLEMERWYGFRVESVTCLPKDIKISAAVCHDATLPEVLAAVSKKGVTIYQNNGMFTFCPPAGKLIKSINNGNDVWLKRQKENHSTLGFWTKWAMLCLNRPIRLPLMPPH